MTPAFRENLGLGLGVLGTGLAAYGAFAGPGKPKNPKRWQDFRKEYDAKEQALRDQEAAEIKQRFPKYYQLDKQLDAARAKKDAYLDIDYIDEGHPLWPKYEKAYDKVRDLEEKYWAAEDKYGPQGLTDIKNKYKKLRDETQQAYLKDVDTFNGLGEAKSIGAMLGGLGLIGVGGKLLSKTAASKENRNDALKGAVVGMSTGAALNTAATAAVLGRKGLTTKSKPFTLQDLNTLANPADYRSGIVSKSQHPEGIRRRFKSVANRLGYKDVAGTPYSFYNDKLKRTVHFNPVKEVKNNSFAVFTEDALKAIDTAEKRNPHYSEALKELRKRVNKSGVNITLGDSKFTTAKGTIAHELGQSTQNRRFLQGAAYSKNLLPLLTLSGAAEASVKDDSNGGIGYGIATAAGATTLANELQASYRGSKAFKTLRGKLSTFKGIPTYAAAASVPGLMYLATKHYKDKRRTKTAAEESSKTNDSALLRNQVHAKSGISDTDFTTYDKLKFRSNLANSAASLAATLAVGTGMLKRNPRLIDNIANITGSKSTKLFKALKWTNKASKAGFAGGLIGSNVLDVKAQNYDPEYKGKNALYKMVGPVINPKSTLEKYHEAYNKPYSNVVTLNHDI